MLLQSLNLHSNLIFFRFKNNSSLVFHLSLIFNNNKLAAPRITITLSPLEKEWMHSFIACAYFCIDSNSWYLSSSVCYPIKNASTSSIVGTIFSCLEIVQQLIVLNLYIVCVKRLMQISIDKYLIAPDFFYFIKLFLSFFNFLILLTVLN